MARQTTLVNVRNMVKSEATKSLTNTTDDSLINQIITNNQTWLAASYDWPFLKLRWTFTIPGGTRYVAFPTVDDLNATFSVNFNRPPKLMIKWNNIWQDVVYGIDEYPEFNYLDSDRAQILDPVQRWQFSDQTNLEIWPINAAGQELRFIGQRTLTPLTSDSSTLDLDDLMVAYFSAAQYLEGKADKRAPDVRNKGVAYMQSIVGAYPVRDRIICVGRGPQFGRKLIRQVPLVLVGGK